MRLAELVGTLSTATDAGTGVPDSHALRGATVANGELVDHRFEGDMAPLLTQLGVLPEPK
jgi:hypothetical protein